MAVHFVEAIILTTLRYGETSKIVKLATRELGVQSAIAKGAFRPRSRFAAGLQLMSEGQAGLALSRHGDLHTLTVFDTQRVRDGLASRLDRFAAAGAVAELMLRGAPPAPLPAAYDLLRDTLGVLEVAPADAVEPLALRSLWRLVSVLGFGPSLLVCARDGEKLPSEGPVAFAMEDGGALCSACARAHAGTRLAREDFEDLLALVTADADLPAPAERHLAAHRRLAARWIRYQLGEGTATPALDFYEHRSWAAL